LTTKDLGKANYGINLEVCYSQSPHAVPSFTQEVFMRLTKFLVAGTLVAGFSAPAAAQNVIWFEDGLAGSSSFASGMTALGGALPGASIYNATSVEEFFTMLNGGGYDLAVFGEHNQSTSAPFLGDIGNYLAGGGRWLGTTWRTDTYMSLMNASFFGTNQATISDNGSAFYSSVWGTSPIALYNPGWGIFSQSYGTTGGSSCVGVFEDTGCAAVLGNGGRSLLLGPLADTYVNGNFGRDAVLNSSLFLLDAEVVSTVPEPVTMTLIATGLAGIAAARRRRKTA
jgi:hypothetical protein